MATNAPLGFVAWFAAQESIPGLDPVIVKRLQEALPLNATTLLARGEPDLWLIAGPNFKAADYGAARLTLRNVVTAWRYYQSRFNRDQRRRVQS